MTGPFDRVTQLHARADTAAVLRGFFFASLPAALLGAWNIGYRLLAGRALAEPGAPAAIDADIWQLNLIDAMGMSHDPPSVLTSVLLGTLLLAPSLLVALAVSRAWAQLFAHVRRRALDPAWALAAWLFVLLLPAGISPLQVGLGISFGVLFGCHLFGGTGRYLVHPALLGAVFLLVAYPASFQAGAWVPGTDLAATWDLLAAGQANSSWFDAALGYQVGVAGATSPLACALGALLLGYRGSASWRTLLGGIAGIGIVGLAFADVPWYWQPVVGSFAFVWAFVLTDPTTMALTSQARWIAATLFGALTVVLRMANPEHPERTLFALLLATLLTPLLDHIVVRREIYVRRRRYAG